MEVLENALDVLLLSLVISSFCHLAENGAAGQGLPAGLAHFREAAKYLEQQCQTSHRWRAVRVPEQACER